VSRPLQDNDVFHAIAHPARRAMLTTLRHGERTASQLAAPFPMSAPAVSQHLRVLEDAGLVAIRKAGRRRFYQLDPVPLRDVVTWADAFAAYFSARLDDLGAYLDRGAAATTGKRKR
jgi:DNA-binding transcriptional ArsR family regulator